MKNRFLKLSRQARIRFIVPFFIICGFSAQSFAAPITDNLIIQNEMGVSPYYYAFTALNVPTSIIAAEVRDNGGSFMSATYEATGNKWFITFPDLISPLVIPLDIRLTNDLGETIVSSDVITDFNNGTQFDFGSNFYQPAAQTVSEPPTILLLFLTMFLALLAHTMPARVKLAVFIENKTLTRI